MSSKTSGHVRLPSYEGGELSDTATIVGSPSPPNDVAARRHYPRQDSENSLYLDDLVKRNAQPTTPLIATNLEYPGRSDRNIRGQGFIGYPTSKDSILARGRPKPTRNSPIIPSPGSARPLLSPAWQRHGSGSIVDDGELRRMFEEALDEEDIAKGRQSHLKDELAGGITHDRDRQKSKRASSYNDNDHTGSRCSPKQDIYNRQGSWLSVSILLLSIYSTVFSGIWMIVAIIQPRYGRSIDSSGTLKPATASTLIALLAKTIEVSFVTVFVAFLGQVLSRRSLIKASRGITISDLTMRQWVIQPGFMITHWGNLRHAGGTILGVFSLIAGLVAMLYTTASDTLVTPHLKVGPWEHKTMYGLVQSSYANPFFIQDNCETPISTTLDPDNAGLTCLSIAHAGQAYHNYIAYVDGWAAINDQGLAESVDLAQRPPAVGMLFDNTTVTGSWIQTNYSNMTSSFQKYNRIVNNVTMAMPHAGVFSAAYDAKNGILQPQDLAGVGEYSISASVVSPTVNVLCANMNASEIAPLVYITWPNAVTMNSTSLPGQKLAWGGYADDIQIRTGQTYLNTTAVDDIFQWGAKYDRQPPVFPMYPIDFNSVANLSVAHSDAIYFLMKSAATTDYTLCEMRSFLYPACSTQYKVSGTTGGQLQSQCDDPSDPNAYDKSFRHPPVTRNTDWRNVASQWALSVTLNSGVSNGNASTTRMLSQLIPTVSSSGTVRLNGVMPSIAESLAVLSGNTLLMSTMSSSYYHFWNFTTPELKSAVYQPFNASISSQQYASGFTQRWQLIFYVPLTLIFVTNVFCLIYFFVRVGLVTDYTEPQNMFALAINSPPSEKLHGSCGAGPDGKQLKVDWHVEQDQVTRHFYIREGEKANGASGQKCDRSDGSDAGDEGECDHIKEKFGMKKRFSATLNHYGKLSSRPRGWL